jgi:flagellum-specific ATP synthase
MKDLAAAYRENEDLIQIGAYASGSSERVDRSIRINEPFKAFLRQDRTEQCVFDETVKRLAELARVAGVAP